MKKLIPLFGITFAVSFSALAETEKTYSASKKANELAQKMIILDGHIDVPYRIASKWFDMTKATKEGDFDYVRAKQGGINAPFMSIYTPARLDDSDESTQMAHRLIDQVEALVGRSPDKYAIALSPTDVREQFKKGLISLPLGMENGSPIQGSLETLAEFQKRGIRYITLTHSKSNHISDSSYDDNKRWGGLSPFGEKVVLEMNKLGIMVDISHVSDEAFYDTLKISKVPLIATHSSMRKFTPGFERNMSDQMVKDLAAKGGVIMINFGSSFVTEEANKYGDIRSAAMEKAEKEMGKDSEEFKEFRATYRERNPYPYANLDQVMDHIDHAVKIAGIDHVGLGSDYDGVGDSLPVGLKTVADYPNLIQEMLNRGYSEADIEKILSGNALRVWQATEDYSKKSS